MVKRLSVFLSFLFIATINFGQKVILIAEGNTPDLYLLHQVKSKENFYSIGRNYNVGPKEIASYNHLQFQNGLAIGQTIKIPLSIENFSQQERDESSESLIPVYHQVQPKEGLFRISIKYNKVSMPVIKKWNHLSSDNVAAGTRLIIGYLKVNSSESSLGKPQANDPITETANVTNMDPVKKEEPSTQSNTINDSNNSKQVVEKETPNTNITPQNFNSGTGYFKKLFADQVADRQITNETASAGIFKSTSGWDDKKYYCFSNDAPSGTIIRVTFSPTGKTVYAKVLDPIPDIKQNEGLTIVLSNAAAQELGAGEKFDCALSFVK